MPLAQKYVREQIASADPEDHKSSVRFVTTQALAAYSRIGNTITAGANGAMAAQDGVTPVTGDDMLLVTGASPIDNGIYRIMNAGSGGTPFQLSRRTDADRDEFVTCGMRVPINEGARFGGKGIEFVLVTPDPIVLNTTALDFDEVKSGGTGTVTKIVNGDVVEVPEGRQMPHVEDLEIEDGDLAIDGDVLSHSAPSNYLIEMVPARSVRTIPRYDVAHFTGILRVEGLLRVYGTLRDVTPDSGQDILAKLGTVLPPDNLIFGGNSPAQAKTPAQARAILGVPTVAEASGLATAAATAALAVVGEIGRLKNTYSPGSGPYQTLAGQLYRFSSSTTDPFLLPPTPVNGDMVAFRFDSDLLPDGGTFFMTLDGQGHDIAYLSILSDTIAIQVAPGGLLFAVYDTAELPNSWHIFGSSTIGEALQPTTNVHSETSILMAVGALTRFNVPDDDDRTFTMPGSPLDGARCGVLHVGSGSPTSGIRLFFNCGGGEIFQLFGPPDSGNPTFLVPFRGSFFVTFRFYAGTNAWIPENFHSSMEWYRYGDSVQTNALTGFGDVENLPAVYPILAGGMLARLGSGPISSMTPSEVLHHFHMDGAVPVVDTPAGTIAEWTPGGATDWRGATLVQAEGDFGVLICGISIIGANVNSDFVFEKWIFNTSGIAPIIFEHESGSAADPTERVYCPDGSNFILRPLQLARIVYSSSLNRWLISGDAVASVNQWSPGVFTGAGPFELSTRRINRYDDGGLAGLVLYLPGNPQYHGVEVTIKEIGYSTNPVTVTTLSGSVPIEELAGGTTNVFSDVLSTPCACVTYKWDEIGVWRIVSKMNT